MKNYVKPSIELNKFDTEEILAPSTPAGALTGYSNLTTKSQSIVDKYVEDGGDSSIKTNQIAEFQW